MLNKDFSLGWLSQAGPTGPSGLITVLANRSEAPTKYCVATALPKLSVIIPVYNERLTIEEILCRVQEVEIEKEIIIVDDGSTDGTRDFLRQLELSVDSDEVILPKTRRKLRTGNIRILFEPQNRGKGAAVRRGFDRAIGDLVVVQDGDLELDPRDYFRLMEPIELGVADVVNGSRFLKRDGDLSSWHYWGNKVFTVVSNMTTGLNLSDVLCCYKMFKREVLQNIELQEEGFGHEAEVTAKIAKAGCRVSEVAISYRRRTYKQGKKITWKDAFRTVWCILRYGLQSPSRTIRSAGGDMKRAAGSLDMAEAVTSASIQPIGD